MSNTNLVIVTGNLGQDPVVEESNGTRYGRFGLANNERFRSKATGSLKAHTNWISIVVFGDLTNSLLRLAMGDKITVIGRLRTDTRTRPADGVKIPTLEIHAQAIDFIKVKSLAPTSENHAGDGDIDAESSAPAPGILPTPSVPTPASPPEDAPAPRTAPKRSRRGKPVTVHADRAEAASAGTQDNPEAESLADDDTVY
jgi:single stranded DNA-binding protein